VLLYELLTGKTPFDANELLQSGLDAMRRTIRKKEPQKARDCNVKIVKVYRSLAYCLISAHDFQTIVETVDHHNSALLSHQ
jgi:hypothetical protein